jgi:hypothetical protein
VNIAAVMAALDVWDLEHMPKMGLLVLACRADRYTGQAEVSLPRLAADLHTHRSTAWRVLRMLSDAGYVIVDNRPGIPSLITLGEATRRAVQPLPVAMCNTPVAPTRLHPSRGRDPKESLEKSKERGAAIAHHTASGAAGDKPGAGPYDHYPNWTAERLNGNRL